MLNGVVLSEEVEYCQFKENTQLLVGYEDRAMGLQSVWMSLVPLGPVQGS